MCCHYSVVGQLRIGAQRRVSCRSQSELVKWQPQDSEIVKLRIAEIKTQNLITLRTRYSEMSAKSLGFGTYL
jgi:hypothetical protein